MEAAAMIFDISDRESRRVRVHVYTLCEIIHWEYNAYPGHSGRLVLWHKHSEWICLIAAMHVVTTKPKCWMQNIHIWTPNLFLLSFFSRSFLFSLSFSLWRSSNYNFTFIKDKVYLPIFRFAVFVEPVLWPRNVWIRPQWWWAHTQTHANRSNERYVPATTTIGDRRP